MDNFYIEWDSGITMDDADSGANVDYQIGDTPYFFTLRAVGGPKGNIEVVIRNFDFKDKDGSLLKASHVLQIRWVTNGDMMLLISGRDGDFTVDTGTRSAW